MKDIRHTIETAPEAGGIHATLMQIGQIGCAINGPWVGDYFLRTYSNLTNLNCPRSTFTPVSGANFHVNLLPEGTKVTLTVGG